jgi:sulfopyruvate decarboxylase subunit alpha
MSGGEKANGLGPDTLKERIALAMAGSARGARICEQLKEYGIGYVGWIADSETYFLHVAMNEDPDLSVVQVCKEGEAVAVLAGLHLGGQRGALLVENQGIFECGNILKWAKGLKIPMVLLTGYLFYRFAESREDGIYINGEKDYTESFYRAFDIPYYIVDSDDSVSLVGEACSVAFKTAQPVAVLLSSADEYEPGT